jgi:[citrate (pro-3S)-lyase] ligase
LPKHGVEVAEFTRVSTGIGQDSFPEYISASKVREAIRNNKIETILQFLPDSTKAFLLSEESSEIRNKIIESKGRH